MAKRNGGTLTRLEREAAELQLFRVRKQAHQLAKAAAAAAGVSLEDWASDALVRDARRQLNRATSRR